MIQFQRNRSIDATPNAVWAMAPWPTTWPVWQGELEHWRRRDLSARLPELSPALFANFRDRRLRDGQRTCRYDLVLLQHILKIARLEWDVRRNHFANGTSVVEEVTEWEAGHKYRVRLSEMASMPLHEAYAEISVEPVSGGRSTMRWSFEYRVKYGPFGWLLGQTMMKMMMRKILDANLKGLADKVGTTQRTTAHPT